MPVRHFPASDPDHAHSDAHRMTFEKWRAEFTREKKD
jgi:hypothetical protein